MSDRDAFRWGVCGMSVFFAFIEIAAAAAPPYRLWFGGVWEWPTWAFALSALVFLRMAWRFAR